MRPDPRSSDAAESRSPDAAIHLDPYDKVRDDKLDFPEVGEKDDEWRESPDYWNGLRVIEGADE